MAIAPRDCGDLVQVKSEPEHICRCQRDQGHDGIHREYVGDDPNGGALYHFWAPASIAKEYVAVPEEAISIPRSIDGIVH